MSKVVPTFKTTAGQSQRFVASNASTGKVERRSTTPASVVETEETTPATTTTKEDRTAAFVEENVQPVHIGIAFSMQIEFNNKQPVQPAP